MYNYMPLTNLATSMPTIVALSVIVSRNSDPPSENMTNTALIVTAVVNKLLIIDDNRNCYQFSNLAIS